MTTAEKSSLTVGYSWQTGFVYVFNLIVGAALLALPKAFAEVGWVLGLISLIVLAVFSYGTVSFVIEVMAISNAVIRYNEKVKTLAVVSTERQNMEVVAVQNPTFVNDDEKSPTSNQENTTVSENKDTAVEIKGNKVVPMNIITDKKIEENSDNSDACLYEITTKVEMGEMAGLFFNKAGIAVYYISICLYLYGGLSVYAAAVAKSVTTVVCNDAKCFNENVTAPCGSSKISVIVTYRVCLAAFVVVICPFAFFNISNTKLLQIFTTTYRWISMISMIVLAFLRISNGQRNPDMKVFVVDKLPNFFGIAVYSFMCQHSIPAVLTPVTNKKRLNMLVVFDFVFIVIFYSTIVLSATFSFDEKDLMDLYSLNFTSPIACKYILQLYPVFTLSANFPVLAIVLRENIMKFFLSRSPTKQHGVFVRRILFPLIVITPPICIACTTYDVSTLANYSGTYAGAVLQYVMPALLVFCARRHANKLLGPSVNKHRSPFHHTFWVVVVMIWYVVCLVFVTYNKIKGN